jgi:hypothetical protein
MRCRSLLVAAAVTAMLASGCSSESPTPQGDDEPDAASSPAPTSAAGPTAPPAATVTTDSAGPPAPLATLEPRACVDITAANLDLAVATTADAARAAADKFLLFSPPVNVIEAIDYFVSTSGPQFGDPEYDRYNGAIDNWINQVCPL